MYQPHPVGVLSSTQLIEGVDPAFVAQGLYRARKNTIQVLDEFRGSLLEGMTENDARILALDIFKAHGVIKHWHKPYIRFGAGTRLTFHDPLQPDYRLRAGDPYYADFGPVWSDPELGLEYEGDYGDSFVFEGSHPEAEKCAKIARQLFFEAQAKWKNEHLSGEEIYRFLQKRADETGYKLLESVAGHRIGDFPHHKHSKQNLSQVQFEPKESLWILEVMLLDPLDRFGAFFEDLL